MTINISDQRPRISKREFLSRVAARSGQPIKTVSSVYEEILSELLEAVVQGETVSLTGFGFYRQTHRGHKVRFGQSEVDDYSVLKFSASRILNRQLEPGPGLAGDEPIETERAHSHSTSATARSLVASA
jgi:nucleoid DNA-binding protein